MGVTPSPAVAPIRPPEKIRHDHDVSSFTSGESSLDDWLKQRAHANEASGASRTYVVCVRNRVVGYYALATGSAGQNIVTGAIRRNMPRPVPVMILGRLAVDREFQGRGVGRGLLRDAIFRTLQAADIVGIRAILVHVLSDQAKQFYERQGFSQSPTHPLMLMISLREAKNLL